jgi:nucleotide-binding universal stress UspA family protein
MMVDVKRMTGRPRAWRGEEIVMPEVHAFSTIPAKILLPIDFSPSSHEALEQATVLAQHFHAEIQLVHVLPTFPTTTLPDVIPEREFTAAARKEAERLFAACKTDLAAKGTKVSFSIEVGNDVAACIQDAIERDNIDMLVISTHGLTGWHPLVFGSIAEKLVRLVHIPILLLHTAKPDSGAKVQSGRLMEWW